MTKREQTGKDCAITTSSRHGIGGEATRVASQWDLLCTMRPISIIVFVLLAVPVCAQNSGALQKAILLEEQEHDLRGAEAAYKALTKSSADIARGEAWLRLGKLYRRVGREAEAKLAFHAAEKTGGALALQAEALLKQDPQDKEHEKQLRARARELIENNSSQTWKDLIWLGEAVTPVLLKCADDLWASSDGKIQSYHPTLRLCLGVAAQLGGPQTMAYFKKLEKSSTEKRIVMLAATASGTQKHKKAWPGHSPNAAVMSQIVGFLDLPDPRTQEWVLDKCASKIVDGDRVLQLLLDANTEVAFGALFVLRDHWPQLTFTNPAAALSKYLMALDQMLRGTDPSMGHEALVALLNTRLVAYSESGIALALRHIPPSYTGPVRSRKASETLQRIHPGHNSELGRALIQASVRLGRQHCIARAYVDGLLRQAYKGWGHEALPTVLKLIKHGAPFDAAWLRTHTTEEDSLDLLRGLPGDEYLGALLHVIQNRRLPPEAMEILVASSLASSNRVESAFTSAVVQTGNIEAGSFLRKLEQDGRRDYAQTCADLIRLSVRAPTKVNIDLLRNALLRQPESKDSPHLRNLIFGRLVQLGVPDILELYTRALPLGFKSDTAFWIKTPGSNYGISWLAESKGASTSDQRFAGYDTPTLAKLWTSILSEDDSRWSRANSYFRGGGTWAIQWGGDLFRDNQPKPSTPSAILGTFARLLSAKFAKQPDGTWSWNGRKHDHDFISEGIAVHEYRAVWHVLAARMINGHPLDELDAESIQELSELCLTLGIPALHAAAIHVLAESPDTTVLSTKEQEGLTALLRVVPLNLFRRLLMTIRRFKLIPEVSADFIRETLNNPDARVRGMFFDLVVMPSNDDLKDIVVLLLKDSDKMMRQRACGYFGMRKDPSASPALVETLRDPEPEVRKAAQVALDAIRYYHEQKAYWSGKSKGPALTPNSAARALLNQANPKQAKATRLKAIRALALLAVPETLPSLIDFSNEADAEIKAAAQKAMQQILQPATQPTKKN